MQLHVYLACAVRCSATGNSLCDAGLSVTVDGLPAKIIRKADGYALFTHMTSGKHQIRFSHPYYNDENRTVEISGDEMAMEVVTMRPILVSGDHLCRLTVNKLKPGEKVYISGKSFPLQLQQSDCKEGTQNLRLFKKGAFGLVPPLLLLCADEKAPETCILCDLIGEDLWQLHKPLTKAHKRGTLFYPTQPYEADKNGTVTATFFAAGPVSVMYGDKLYALTVEEGETLWQIP